MTDTSTTTPSPSPAAHWAPPKKKPLITALIILVAISAVLMVLNAWDFPPFAGGAETTNNAYIKGRTTIIAPQVSGYVVAVPVQDYEHVKKGQELVHIDDRIYSARVESARANLEAQQAGLADARAQLLRAQADMKRVDNLVKGGATSIQLRDQTLAALRHAEAQVGVSAEQTQASSDNEDGHPLDIVKGGLEAQVDAAKAQLELAQIDLDNTVIRAAEDGQAGEIGVRLGQYVTNGTQLFSLVPDERWIIANYKEAQTAHINSGQKASFTVDALDDKKFTGTVESLSPAAGSEFSALKPDNATGNFVKVPQRIGVRIAIDQNQTMAERLRPGMSVEMRVDTRP